MENNYSHLLDLKGNRLRDELMDITLSAINQIEGIKIALSNGEFAVGYDHNDNAKYIFSISYHEDELVDYLQYHNEKEYIEYVKKEGFIEDEMEEEITPLKL